MAYHCQYQSLLVCFYSIPSWSVHMFVPYWKIGKKFFSVEFCCIRKTKQKANFVHNWEFKRNDTWQWTVSENIWWNRHQLSFQMLWKGPTRPSFPSGCLSNERPSKNISTVKTIWRVSLALIVYLFLNVTQRRWSTHNCALCVYLFEWDCVCVYSMTLDYKELTTDRKINAFYRWTHSKTPWIKTIETI